VSEVTAELGYETCYRIGMIDTPAYEHNTTRLPNGRENEEKFNRCYSDKTSVYRGCRRTVSGSRVSVSDNCMTSISRWMRHDQDLRTRDTDELRPRRVNVFRSSYDCATKRDRGPESPCHFETCPDLLIHKSDVVGIDNISARIGLTRE